MLTQCLIKSTAAQPQCKSPSELVRYGLRLRECLQTVHLCHR